MKPAKGQAKVQAKLPAKVPDLRAPERLPYMPLFVDDWLSSDRVDRLPPDQAYGYMLLLMHQWKAKDGYLPKDEVTLARWSRFNGRWRALGRPLLREFFVLRNGHYFNRKLREKWLHVHHRREQARHAAESRWKKH